VIIFMPKPLSRLLEFVISKRFICSAPQHLLKQIEQTNISYFVSYKMLKIFLHITNSDKFVSAKCILLMSDRVYISRYFLKKRNLKEKFGWFKIQRSFKLITHPYLFGSWLRSLLKSFGHNKALHRLLNLLCSFYILQSNFVGQTLHLKEAQKKPLLTVNKF